MELPVLLLALVFVESSSAIRCYQCDPNPRQDLAKEQQKTFCDYFDGSASYYVDCPRSSMCTKTFTKYDVGGETTTMTERGCAQQSFSGDQRKINGEWKVVDVIYEVYEEKCFEDPTEADKLTRTTHCFCRGDLCNGADRAISGANLAILTVIMLLKAAVGMTDLF